MNRRSITGCGLALVCLVLAGPAAGALISFDFTGPDPGLNAPWTAPAAIAEGLVLAQGVSISPAPAETFTGWEADDFFGFRINGPGGTDTQLAWALANNMYVTFTIAPESGWVLNLAGAQVLADVLHTDQHGVRQVAIFSSIGGFTADKALAVSPQTPKWSIPTSATASGTMPADPIYNGITEPVEFRLYVYGNQYAWKVGGVDNVSIGGEVVPEPASLALLACGGLLGLRRRRAR